jgi:hypothetical protein
MQAIEAIGTRVVPAVRERLAGKSGISETSVMSRLKCDVRLAAARIRE